MVPTLADLELTYKAFTLTDIKKQCSLGSLWVALRYTLRTQVRFAHLFLTKCVHGNISLQTGSKQKDLKPKSETHSASVISVRTKTKTCNVIAGKGTLVHFSINKI